MPDDLREIAQQLADAISAIHSRNGPLLMLAYLYSRNASEALERMQREKIDAETPEDKAA